MSRWNSKDQKNVSFDQMGSKIGGIFTLILYISLMCYFSYLTTRMYDGLDDNIQSLTRANDLKNGHDEIEIS